LTVTMALYTKLVETTNSWRRTNFLRIFILSQRCSWDLRHSGMWHSVAGKMVPDVSRQPNGLVFDDWNNFLKELHPFRSRAPTRISACVARHFENRVWWFVTQYL
jgi:hypothetical protein